MGVPRSEYWAFERSHYRWHALREARLSVHCSFTARLQAQALQVPLDGITIEISIFARYCRVPVCFFECWNCSTGVPGVLTH